MEYNLDGMAPPKKPNIFKQVWQGIASPHYGRTIGFLTLLVIALSVPATIAFLGRQTNLQQKAAGGVNGDVKFSSDPAGNNVISTTSNPELYLKISLPDNWHLPGQSAGQKSSPIAYSPIKNIIQKTYAATFCTSPAVCSTTTGVPADQWTPTGDTCMLNNEGDEFPGACYIRNTGGGSAPTATPNPGSGGGSTGGSCSTYNNNCGGCLNQPACAYTDGGQCVSVDPNVGNICPAGKTTWYWANCSTNACAGGGGSSTGRCGLVQVQNHSVALNGNIPVRIVYGGNPTKVKFWISSDSEIGKNSTEVSSWSPIGEQSLTSSDAVYQVSSSGFGTGQHAVLAQLLNSGGNVLDENRSTCADSFNIGSGGGSGATATPTQAAAGGGSGIFPAPGAAITGSTVQLRWNSASNPTHYHVRVNNEANQTALAANVSREPGCPNNLFVCTETTNYWLDIPLPNPGTYFWWVDADGAPGHIAEGNFTVSGSSGGTPPGGQTTTVTLTQIHIENIDQGGSGGHEAVRIDGATNLANFFANPYWKLNTTGGATRMVSVVFYGTDAQGNAVQKVTGSSINYTGTNTPPPPAATPTRTPFGCEKKPSEMGNDLSDNLYRWVQVNRADSGGQPLSSCQDDHLNSSVCVVLPGTTNAEKNAQCPQNTTSSFVEASTSNWCRNTPGGDATVAHCWQLQYIGSPAGPGANPTAPPPVPTVPAGQPTPTPMPGCTYTQTTCSGTSDAAANKVCSDANINSNWCYGGRCVTCAAASSGTGTPPPSTTCQTSYTISGRVTKQDNQPVEQATVCLDPSADGYSCTSNLTAITDASGNYTITVPAGEINNDGHNVYALKKVITAGSTQGTIVGSTLYLLGGGQLCRNSTGINLSTTFSTPGVIPTPTSSVTPPPPGPASITFKVVLTGVGIKASKGTQATNNPNPYQTQRDATVYLYPPGVDATGDFSGSKGIKISQPKAFVYDNNGNFVATNFNLGSSFIPGQYQVFVWTPGFLRKRIPNIQTLNAGANTINQVVTLTLGDANNDNHLDTLDYQVYLSCIGKQTTDCLKVDFNDDGKIDTRTPTPSFLDHALFTSQFAIVDGD